ncbi:hypothetical protein ACFV23_02800 [Streptomyces sp. NPDC059627]
MPAPGEPPYWWLEGPNQWPAALPVLREVSLEWMAWLSAVAHRLLPELIAAVGGPDDLYDDAFSGHPRNHLRLVRYPGRAPEGDDQGMDMHTAS